MIISEHWKLTFGTWVNLINERKYSMNYDNINNCFMLYCTKTMIIPLHAMTYSQEQNIIATILQRECV